MCIAAFTNPTESQLGAIKIKFNTADPFTPRSCKGSSGFLSNSRHFVIPRQVHPLGSAPLPSVCAMKAYGGMDVWIHVLVTSALVAGEWSASRPCRFTPGERVPGTHWIEGLEGPRVGLDDLTLPGLDRPALSHYTDWVNS
jgi:hypothetical protein